MTDNNTNNTNNTNNNNIKDEKLPKLTDVMGKESTLQEISNKITDSVRDLFNVKVTLPLGNRNLKLVHTNQFLFTTFDKDIMQLKNMGIIANVLDSGGSIIRKANYKTNKWYIDSITITNDGNTAKMELDLNPFPSQISSYVKSKYDYIKAYEDALPKDDENNIPSVATNNNLGDGSMTDAEITALAKKVSYGGMGSGHDPEKGFKNLTVNHRGDCYDITAGLYYAYNFKVGIPARDIVAESGSSKSGTHHCCQIQKNGNWVFPDFYKHCTWELGVNGAMKKGKFDVAREPPSSDGTIPKYCAKCGKRWP